MASPSRPVITLTTDFGMADPYVGVMKGVIFRINPEAKVVDLTHQVSPQDIQQGAFLLGSSYRFFPNHTVHVVVVDPEVGSTRRPLLLETPQGRFVAPDNGVLSHVLRDGGAPSPNPQGQVSLPEGWRAFHLTNSSYWLHPLSATFHGRDVFAPSAAHLTLGVSPQELGQRVDKITCLRLSTPEWQGDRLQGRVVHIDRFGNMVTDIHRYALDQGQRLEIEVKDRRISGLRAFYADGDGLMALIGSYDTLELAVKNGSAAAELDGRIGDALLVTRGS